METHRVAVRQHGNPAERARFANRCFDDALLAAGRRAAAITTEAVDHAVAAATAGAPVGSSTPMLPSSYMDGGVVVNSAAPTGPRSTVYRWHPETICVMSLTAQHLEVTR